jgi:hypothetical protein
MYNQLFIPLKQTPYYCIMLPLNLMMSVKTSLNYKSFKKYPLIFRLVLNN